MNDPIDVVYTWVDSIDPIWKKKKKSFESKNPTVTKNGTSQTRFIDTNELKYSIRSIRTYLPWVRNIFIVTDQQTPRWLDPNSNIKIVDHKDIIPKVFLPTFNSNTIEWHIHRIDGLSEKFIYFCDDFLVGSKLNRSDFFTNTGKPIYRCTEEFKEKGVFAPLPINKILDMRSEDNSTLGMPHFDNSFEMVEQDLGRALGRFFLKHAPIPFTKSQLEDSYNSYKKYLKRMSESRFRSTSDISSQYIIAAKNINLDKGVADTDRQSVFEWVANVGVDQPPSELMRVFSSDCKFISIATGNDFDQRRLDYAQDILRIKYPLKCIDEDIDIPEDPAAQRLNEIIATHQVEYEERRAKRVPASRKPHKLPLTAGRIKAKLRNLRKIKSDTHKSEKALIKKSGLFNASWYLKQNPDVKENNIEPLDHFISHGGYEGRDPSTKFSVSMYKALNYQVNFEGVHPLIHYILHKDKHHRSYDSRSFAEYLEQINTSIIDSANKSGILLVMESMDWFSKMSQRPHHLARLLSEKGVTVVYIDIHRSVPISIEKNLYIVDKSFDISLKTGKYTKRYYWVFSTVGYAQDYLDKPLEAGYEIAYDYIDDFDETISEGVENQKALYRRIKQVNPKLLIGSADRLVKQLVKDMHRNDILTIKNAVDMNHFNTGITYSLEEAPADMKPIISSDRPIVGYYGAIAPWLDYELINTITLQQSDKEFVFIGVDYGGALKNLVSRHNVHILGPKDYAELPKYSYWFDCALIPFKRGDVAKSTSPVKLFEYMAMGIPTVCTKDLLECYGYDFVYIADGQDQFMQKIDLAVSQRRTQIAQKSLEDSAYKNTWQARVEEIYKNL